jgi:hypothetical protein
VTPPAPFRSVSGIPGRGSKISLIKASQQPPPVPRENNSWWLELEKRIGATLDITLVPLPQYTEKATLLIAGGQIPDILLISPLSVPDQYRAVQDGAFADLTAALSAESLKAYPNLSLYPASAWKNSLVRGKAYGVPRLGLSIGPALLYRQDWAEKLGISPPRNADDFLRLVTGMSKNDPDGNGKPDTFGLGSQNGDWSMPFIQGMHRVPNGWKLNSDGTLTHAIETDEYRQAIAFARKCFEAGAYYPDAATLNRTQATNALIAGQIGGYADQLVQLNGDIRTRFEAKKINPAANVAALVPPGFDGGQSYTYNGTGFGSTAAFPASAAKQQGRVEELLRVLDYYSAPFGSEEYNFLTFGIEGVHHTLQPDGTRILTDRGRRRGERRGAALPQLRLDRVHGLFRLAQADVHRLAIDPDRLDLVPALHQRHHLRRQRIHVGGGGWVRLCHWDRRCGRSRHGVELPLHAVDRRLRLGQAHAGEFAIAFHGHDLVALAQQRRQFGLPLRRAGGGRGRRILQRRRAGGGRGRWRCLRRGLPRRCRLVQHFLDARVGGDLGRWAEFDRMRLLGVAIFQRIAGVEHVLDALHDVVAPAHSISWGSTKCEVRSTN